MIDRQDYHLMMTCLLEVVAEARSEHDFVGQMQQFIIASYEINDPDNGRVNIVDLTPYVKEATGGSWYYFSDIGIISIEIVQFYLKGDLILEAGRMLGQGKEDVAIQAISDLPEHVLKGFAKGMTIGMRDNDVHILKRLTGEEDEDYARLGDSLNLAALVNRFLEEEVDETVAKFSAQLDAVFGVADVPRPWSPPEGGAHEPPG